MNTTERDLVSKPKSGSVVEVVTPRGLATAVIVSTQKDSFEGYLVRNNAHYDVVQPYEGLLDEVIEVIEDERAATMINDDGEGVVIFREGDELMVHLVGHARRYRRVHSLPAALRIATTHFQQVNDHASADQIVRLHDMHISMITDALGIPELDVP
jgi:hypothetical protein